MDTYVEWLVKRKNDTSVLVLRILIMVVAVLLGFAGFFILLGIIPTISVLVLAACVWGGWKINQRFNLEFEYILTNFDLDIDQITAQRKRKRLISLSLTGIQQFGRYDLAHKHQVENVGEQKRLDASTHNNGETYYFVCNDKKHGRTLVLFSPEERILKAVKTANPQAMV